MKRRNKRLKVLTQKEIRDLYGLPRLSQEERDLYFSLNLSEKSEMEKLRSIPTKVYFVLELGYFKLKRLFFQIEFQQVREDIHYIVRRYFPEPDPLNDLDFGKSTMIYIQNKILNLTGYQLCSQQIKHKLQEKADHFVTICTKPVFVLKELLNYLENQRVVIPGYSFMQEVIGKSLTKERTRLESGIMREFPQEGLIILKNLLTVVDGIHTITLFRKEPKDFSFKEISREISKAKTLREIYFFAQVFLPKTGISNENIKYYASLVSFYTVYKLKRMKQATAFLYLICFVFIRFQKAVDNLVNTFIYHTSQYNNEAKKVAKERVYELKIEGNKHLPNAGKVLDLFVDENIPENTDFGSVRKIAFRILDREKIPFVSKFINELELHELKKPAEQFLNELEQKLETAFKEVNCRIEETKNKDIKISGKGDKITWRLPYKRD